MDTSNEIILTGKLTIADYQKHNYYHHKKLLLFFFILSFFTFLILYISSGVVSGTRTLVEFVGVVLASMFSGLILLIMWVILKIRIRNEYNSDQILQNELTYIITCDGITQKIKKSINNIEWNDIIAVYEHNELFQLYISKNKAIVLPKKFFTSVKDADLFKKVIIQNVKIKKVKLM
ncbi:YcxB family protein [Alkalihalobacterium elongatum]|uniref:YcxB family protein n=1 Tax=Alkalihalobacterium elongatum TaxID=2675466 RepID=UPI001C1FE79D|nr:YcxB family protein [Alkalihalobacterium elongatum]